MDPDWISTGSTSTITMMRMGQKGERKKPSTEKPTAESIRLGTTQMTTSRAREMSVLQVSTKCAESPTWTMMALRGCDVQENDHVVLPHVVRDRYENEPANRHA